MKKYLKYLIPAVFLIVGLGVGFFGGTKFQQGKVQGVNTQFIPGQQRVRFGGNANGNFQALRPVSGEVISADDKSITVKMSDGSTKIVFLSGNTTVEKTDPAQTKDLATGTKVAVFGSTNPDGSVTAQNIQINPVIRMFGSPGPSPSPAK
ncbi:MAG TPA: DUF5666 domain-containing protein [Patescibacteria group bacterium]